MSLAFCDGMTTYDSDTAGYKYNYIYPFTQVTVSPSGGGVNNCSYSQVRFGAIERVHKTLEKWTVGFRFQNASSAVPTTDLYFGNQHLANQIQTIVTAVVQQDRTIAIFTANGICIANTGTGGATVLPNNDGWQYIELRFYVLDQRRTGSTDPLDLTLWAAAEIRLNSQLVSAPLGTLIDTGITASTLLFGTSLINTSEFLGDNLLADIYIKANDGDDLTPTNDFYYSDCKIISVFPTSDATDTDWTGSFANIDANPPPGSGIIPGLPDPSFSNYYFGHISPSFTGIIATVMLWYVANGDGASFVHGYIGNPPNRYEGAEGGQPQPAQNFYFSTHFTQNYDLSVESPWTTANFNAESFGFYT